MQVMKESFPDIILPPKETTGKMFIAAPNDQLQPLVSDALSSCN